jgi:hypothetical protein
MTKASRLICVSQSDPHTVPRQLESGDTVLETDTGLFAHFTHGNGLVLTVPTIASVGVANVAEVASCTSAIEGAQCVQRVRFKAGGWFELRLAEDGELLSFTGEAITVISAPQGRVLVGPISEHRQRA